MNTIKERFEEKFPQGVLSDHDTDCTTDIFAFFQQELLALADEIEETKNERSYSKVRDQVDYVEKASSDAAFLIAAALIRSKANELSN